MTLQRDIRKWGTRMRRVHDDMKKTLELLQALPEETDNERRDRSLHCLVTDLDAILDQVLWYVEKLEELETHPLMAKKYSVLSEEIKEMKQCKK